MSAKAISDHPAATSAPEPGSGGMYVAESGTPGSPAIVFIHGAGQSSREWRGHMARLGQFHCLAPDLPGFGRSDRLAPASKERVADLVAELIETRVPAKRASVVGISSGGLHIHALLDRHPDRVERAFVDGSPPYDAPRVGRALMRLFMVALVPFVHTRPGMAVFRASHDPEDLRVASRLAVGRTIGECFGTFAAISAPCPTLLIAGERESVVRSSNAALAVLMPHGEAWYAPRLGHCWQRVAPDLHIRTVEAWVDGEPLPTDLRPEPAPSPRVVERVRAGAVRATGADHAPPEAPFPSGLSWIWLVAGLGGLIGLSARLRTRVAVVGLAAAVALLVLRGRTLLARLTELTITRPSGPLGRMLYRDATSMHGEYWRIFHERLTLTREHHLLDVGCGGGTFLSQVLETVDRAAGLDHSPDMVELTKQNNARAVTEGRLDVRLGDAAGLPWDDATFDAVSNLAAFFAAPEPKAVLREAARVLKPGGRFVVVTMAAPAADGHGGRLMRWLMPQAKLYRDEELATMLEDAGFGQVEAYSRGDGTQVGVGVRG